MAHKSQSLRGIAKLSFCLVACVFIIELKKTLIDKNPKMYDYLEVLNQVQAFFGVFFFIKSRKIHFRGCLTSLGNDEILECFALNARIWG